MIEAERNHHDRPVPDRKEETTMRRSTVLVAGLLAMAMLGALAAPAFAGRGTNAVGSGSPISTNPNMPGTKYEGPLSILYFPVDDAGNVNVYFSLRLRHGNDLDGFAGMAGPLDYNNISAIQMAIHDFIGNEVIPNLYPDDMGYPCTACPPWDVKSVDQLVSDSCSAPGCQLFDILDVVIGVQD